MNTLQLPDDAARARGAASSKVGSWLQKRFREQPGSGPAAWWPGSHLNYSTMLAKSEDRGSNTDYENTKLSDMASRDCRYPEPVPVLRHVESMQAPANSQAITGAVESQL